MLAVSGRLNPKLGGPSVMVPVDQELVELLYKPSQWRVSHDPAAGEISVASFDLDPSAAAPHDSSRKQTTAAAPGPGGPGIGARVLQR